MKEKSKKPKVTVALVGKYVELHDAYISVREALNHAALYLGLELEILWLHSTDLEKSDGLIALENVNGIVIPGGFGSRGIEGKILAARFARENKIPYFGLCLGMQLLVVEFARFILDTTNANSTEFDLNTSNPVIDLLPEQHQIADLGGTMRLGLYPCQIQKPSRAYTAYKKNSVQERHRHRFEFNNLYREILEKNGMRFSGLSPDHQLVEIVELINHPFMIGTQFHPEFLSRPNRPHPLFIAFIKAVAENANIHD